MSEDVKSKTPFLSEQVEPVREILFIQRAVEDDKFGNSPIIRPETMRAEMGLATVLSVGPEVKTIVPGDRIYLGKLAGLKMTELGDGYFLVHQNEVLAIIR
jgi:co-chaperonin GroES (HSP10)